MVFSVRSEVRHEQPGGGLAERDASWSLNCIPDTPRRAHKYTIKITAETFLTPTHMSWAHSGYKLTTGASSSKLRHLGAYYWFINILYLHTSDYNRLNYGKDMCNRTCCYLTCNCQPSLSLCRFAFPFLIGGWYKPYFSQDRTKRRRQKT